MFYKKNLSYKNNHGFSLVELIIVIAIMALLSAALAPQLMKYIEKSRKSTDSSTCKSIESCVNAILSDDESVTSTTTNSSGASHTSHESIWDRVATRGGTFYFYLRVDESNDKILIAGLWDNHPTANAIRDAVTNLKNPKQTGKHSYMVRVDSIKTVESTNPDGSENYLYSIKGIECTTSHYKFSANDSNSINTPK